MKNTVITVLIIISTLSTTAQQLLTPTNTFSHKKTAYISLSDGTEVQGTIKKIDRKKGLIEKIKIVEGTGNILDLQPEMINHMYLPPSGLDKLQKTALLIDDVQRWNDEKLNQDLLRNNYVYFELSVVKLKKESRKLLMQLLNPKYSKYIKVYYDPFTNETGSFNMGDFKLAGGIAKSYYVAKGNNAAFKLQKKNYVEEFVPLWQSCDELIGKFTKPKWRDLAHHIIVYSKCMDTKL